MADTQNRCAVADPEAPPVFSNDQSKSSKAADSGIELVDAETADGLPPDSGANQATDIKVAKEIAPRGKPPTVFKRPLSYFTFEWFTKLLWTGSKVKVEYDHLFELPDDLFSNKNYPEFEKQWEAQTKKAQATEKGRASLAKAQTGHGYRVLFRTLSHRHWFIVILGLGLQLGYTAFQFSGPIILNQLISYMQGKFTGKTHVSTELAYILAALLFVFPLCGAVCATHANRLFIGVQVQIRSEIAAALYRKSLRLSSRAKQITETGKIVNLMSADINQIMTFFYPFFSQLITAPITIIGAIIFLVIEIKWATCIGVAVLLLCTPVSGRFVQRLSQLRREMLKYTDKRVKLMNQLLVGIRVLKMYAWEAAQEAAVLEARNEELHELRRCVPMRVGMQTLLFAAPILAAVSSFVAYGAASPENFTPKTIFTSIALFNLLRFPLIMVPFALVQLGNAFVSMGRITQFLLLEERKELVQSMDEPGLKIIDGTFFWPEGLPELTSGAKSKKKKGEKRRGRGCFPGRSAKRQAGAEKAQEEAAAKEGDKVVTTGTRTPDPVKEAAGKVLPPPADDLRSRSVSTESDSSASKEQDSSAQETADSTKDSAVEIKAEDERRARQRRQRRARQRRQRQATSGKTHEGEKKEGDGCFCLRDINLSVNKGQLVCVVGRVGSGKSSLISAILGEMEQQSGSVLLGGRMAYVAQQAWIVNDTLLNNVLFGQEFEEQKWKDCVHACCLESDMKVLPGGSHTEIGEKGINLSGGQKQRVSLARATYQQSDVYILDDPLSAVDVHVGKHIFDNCITGLLSHTTRLLVTNQLQYLDQADCIVFMESGAISVQGTLEECKSNEAFQRMLNEFNSQAGQQGPAEEEEGDVVDSSVVSGPMAGHKPPAKRVHLTRQDTAEITRGITSSVYHMAGARSMSVIRDNTMGDSGDSEDSPTPTSTDPSVPSQHADSSKEISHDDDSRKETLGDADSYKETQQTLRETLQKEDEQETPFGDAGGPASDDEDVVLQGGREDVSQKPSQRGVVYPGVEAAKKVLMEDQADFKKKVAPNGLPIAPSVKYTAKQQKVKGRLVVKEDQEEGQIGMKVYWYYIKAFAVPSFIALLVLWSCEQSARVLTNWWLSRWTSAQLDNQIKEANGQPTESVLLEYMLVYLGLAAAFVMFTFTRSWNNLMAALRASRLVHSNSLYHLVRAPVVFFDTTPVGRILNRYSKDTDDMDFMLPQSISEFGNCVFQLLSTVIFICIIQPWFIAGVVPLAALYWTFQHYYRRSYIELQRLDAVTRSPIYAHFSETLTGTETIRAYGRTKQFGFDNEKKVDYNHRAYFNLKIADEWLSMRLDLVGASLTFMAAILAVNRAGTRSAGILALTLTESLEVTAFLKYAVRAAAMFESRFSSVERLKAYVHLPQEAPRMIEDKSPPPTWPPEGSITFKDVSMRYRQGLDPVLKGVSFHVASGDKVGIVGRTGSGKSSLIVTLFRLVEPFQGSIVLDGVDILEIGLDDIRGRIAAIPQDPILFSGSIRSNLDPFQKHSDADLWDALAHVALKDTVSGLPGGVQARVSEGGDNFSLGQRQLLCVARALLRRPRVLVADEATASVDTETDSFIQKTIRTNFNHCTVLTIAHRLNTILDSTKVLVMDHGVVQEYDTVPRLLSKRTSTFRSMVSDAGLLDESSSTPQQAVE